MLGHCCMPIALEFIHIWVMEIFNFSLLPLIAPETQRFLLTAHSPLTFTVEISQIRQCDYPIWRCSANGFNLAPRSILAFLNIPESLTCCCPVLKARLGTKPVFWMSPLYINSDDKCAVMLPGKTFFAKLRRGISK